MKTYPAIYEGSLYLSGCDLSGVTLPQSVGGSLDLRGCDLTGVTLPQSVGGWLDLHGCDLTGVTLPQSVGDWLDLQGCDLAGVTLPQSVGGLLDLRRCRGVDVLADDGEYELVVVRIGSDWRYVAGCRNFDRTAALAHWDRPDRRAQVFRAAILADERC